MRFINVLLTYLLTQVVHTRASILSPNRVIFDTGKEWYKCSVARNITAKRNGNYDRVYDFTCGLTIYRLRSPVN